MTVAEAIWEVNDPTHNKQSNSRMERRQWAPEAWHDAWCGTESVPPPPQCSAVPSRGKGVFRSGGTHSLTSTGQSFETLQSPRGHSVKGPRNLQN